MKCICSKKNWNFVCNILQGVSLEMYNNVRWPIIFNKLSLYDYENNSRTHSAAVYSPRKDHFVESRFVCK